MKLFSKEKGIVLSILNAVLVIWIITATVITISNVTNLIVKDYEYNYSEYEILYCDYEYITKDECKINYESYKLDDKLYGTEYKRNIIIAVSNIVLVSMALFIFNIEKKTK